MVSLIGIVLLIYGILGVIVTLMVYGKVKTPLQKLQDLLKTLAQKLGKGGAAASAAAGVIGGNGKSLLANIADKLSAAAGAIGMVASYFGEAAGFLTAAKNSLNPVEVPALNPQIDNLEVNLNFDLITGIRMQEHQIPSFIIFGPPLEIDKTPTALNIGPMPVITALGLQVNHPFGPVAGALGSAAEKFGATQNQFSQTGQSIAAVKDFLTNTGVPVAENTAGELNKLGNDLKEAESAVNEMSSNNLFTLVPKLVVGYFGFIHLAFALAGIAILSLAN